MKFVCDAMLGRLAKYLRILGLDAAFAREGDPSISCEGDCYFVTRKRALKGKENTVFIRSDKARDQVREMASLIRPFIDPGKIMRRCIECNLPLNDATRADVEGQVPEFIFHHYERFRRCPHCGKVYWEGSHTARMAAFIKEVFRDEEVE
jgi:uncharacterized protein